jgi:hypothetical protein
MALVEASSKGSIRMKAKGVALFGHAPQVLRNCGQQEFIVGTG